MEGDQKQYEEVRIIDYLKIILNKKAIIIACFLVGFLGALILCHFSPKIYRVSGILEIGMINEIPIEPVESLIGKIKSNIFLTSLREKLNISEAQVPEIKTTNPANTDLIKMEIETQDTNWAKNILEGMFELVLNDQEAKIVTKIESLQGNIKLEENNVSDLNDRIRQIQNLIIFEEIAKKNLQDKEKILEQSSPYQQIEQGLSGSLFTLLDIREKINEKDQEIEKLGIQKNETEIVINASKNRIISLREQVDNIKPAKILKTPTISEDPINPSAKLKAAIAGFSGLVMGVFLVFFIEWWKRASK